MTAPAVLGRGDVVDGRYELGATLGVGGMSEVFRAHDRDTGEAVAVKILRGVDPSFPERFAREARALEQLDEPGIVRLRGRGLDRGQAYLVLDLVEGESLAERLGRGPLDPAATAQLGAALAAALAHAHAAGIVHRDVKPANVLLATDGRAKLVDFGIATIADTTGITVAGTVIGTPTYLAPEQVRGERVGPPADVYALGLVLLEAVTGHRAFTGTPTESAAARLVASPTVPTSVDPGLAGIVAAMTALDPGARPDPVHVAAWLGDVPVAPSPAPGGDATVIDHLVVDPAAPATTVLPLVANRPPRRRPAGAVVAAVLVALLALALLVANVGSDPPTTGVGPSSTTSVAPTTTVAPTTLPPTTAAPTTAPTTAPPTTKGPKGKDSKGGSGDG
ncbi:MAG: serine/threonine-protein kinase [Acidimicrobiales bacterium]